uniref:RNA-directed RNA polymerase n=1 Tax=Leviviridae sp. TaxID=2027243 RepID=A0A514DD71_9VIRU|nr:MAG: RNA-dependent RNA polymerase [Leviviridae sp.]
MKSQADNLLLVAESLLLEDFSLAYPALREKFIKDFDRLALYCRTRGLAFFTLDLPHLDSLLIRGLEVGCLTLEGPLSKRVSKRVRVPRLFSGLWLRVFDRSACLREDVDVTALFFLRQLCRLGKKIAVECSSDRLQATLGAYHDIERTLRGPTGRWDLDRIDVEGAGDHQFGDLLASSGQEDLFALRETHEGEETQKAGLERLLDQVQQVADLISGEIGPYDPLWYSYQRESSGKSIGFRHGPGAVAERLKQWEKSHFPNWPAKLENTFPFRMFGTTLSFTNDVRHPLNHEVPSRLIAVPKTAKGPRLIAAEPTAHQYCQQGMLTFLMDRMEHSKIGMFIDLRDQGKSGRMVLKSSLDRKLATVDLSDASDRLTCWTVERMFRKNTSLLTALHAARTRYVRDKISTVPSFLKPKKFASQGTAVTFPVQSLVFLSIALGCCLDGEVSWQKIVKLREQVRVYGDDIIIPVYGYERLIRVMDALQLKVNKAKSFVSGHFRESCGVDGYRGYDVTPLNPTTVVADNPAACQSVIDTVNNLFSKGLWHASNRLRSLIPARVSREIRIVGINALGSTGFASYCGSDESHLRTRWNNRLHRYEVRVWRVFIRTQERTRSGWPALLDFFTSEYNPEYSRVVSTYADARRTFTGLSWEPCSSHAQHDTALFRNGPSPRFFETRIGTRERSGDRSITTTDLRPLSGHAYPA